MTVTIVRFSKDQSAPWNEFLSHAKNELFLFNRAYMDYHADRFQDHSLFIFKSGKPLAIFPANEKDGFIFSHGGLTFGGLVLSPEIKVAEVLEVFERINEYYRSLGFSEIIYKSIPSIFHKYPAQEDLYALTRVGAVLSRRDVSSVIDLSRPIRFSETKRQLINKCSTAGVQVVEATDFSGSWELLCSVLEKFSVKPVHSLDEINLLRERFPGKIRLFEARLNEEILAGVVIYDYNGVVHTQYMANSPEGRKMGALDFVNAQLIRETFNTRKYYSFGISTEQEGRFLNEGLVQQKELMGGRAIVHDFYKIIL